MQNRRQSSVLKEKQTVSIEFHTQFFLFVKNEGEINTFSEKQKQI